MDVGVFSLHVYLSNYFSTLNCVQYFTHISLYIDVNLNTPVSAVTWHLKVVSIILKGILLPEGQTFGSTYCRDCKFAKKSLNLEIQWEGVGVGGR